LWQVSEKSPVAPVKKPVFEGAARLIHVIKMGVEFYRRQSLRNRRFFRKVRREDG
jgi:hypothetical protein